jgi:hypothetical protein
MSLFPDVAGGRWVRTPEPLGNRTDLEDGGIQAFALPGLASQRYRWRADWAINAYQTEQYLLEAHWNLYKHTHFAMFDGWWSRWTGLAVGTGDGVETIFDLPGKSIDSADLTMLLAGVPEAGYTFAAGAGSGGKDRVTFTVAPGNGVAVTTSWLSGRRWFPKVWYEFASPSPGNNEADLWQWAVGLIEDPS